MRESSLNPSAKNGGLFQIQYPADYGISPGDIGNFEAQIESAASVLSQRAAKFGSVELAIASWTLGVSKTLTLYSAGGLQSVRSAFLDLKFPQYGTVGPDYIDEIFEFLK